MTTIVSNFYYLLKIFCISAVTEYFVFDIVCVV